MRKEDHMRKIAFSLGIAALGLALVAGVWAAASVKIVGTAKNDVLKGTPRADVIDGRRGNDRLTGLAGNDVLLGGAGNDTLSGGAGADRIRCGSGRDTANADAADTVGADCERVKGLPAPVPPPTEPPPQPPPPPPPPPAQRAVAGHYCGFTNQGKSICFDVSADSRVANMDTTSDVDCETVRIENLGLSFSGSVPIQPDLSFTFAYSGGLQSGDPDVTNVTTTYSVTGKFDTAGNATGTLSLSRFSFDYRGTHYDCAAAGYAWQARVGA
jgi:RTX calcium-binding nonapeptide repeat (4 copies)